MNPPTIAALATAIVSIIGAITAAIVAVKSNGTANTAHLVASDAHERLNQMQAPPMNIPPSKVEKDR